MWAFSAQGPHLKGTACWQLAFVMRSKKKSTNSLSVLPKSLAAILLLAAASSSASPAAHPTKQNPSPAMSFQSRIHYSWEESSGGMRELRSRFDAQQLALLEKLNRSDLRHLPRQKVLVVPGRWDLDELAYSPLPHTYAWAEQYPKAIVIHQPLQVFGAYAKGKLVRWGPVSSGRKTAPTPSGLFHMNWKSKGRHSTVNPAWFMRWYFNFHTKRGLALHAYRLPGCPASHACVRLLPRDAEWLFHWGEGWKPGTRGWDVVQHGTPVLILGGYDFNSPPPWRSPESLQAATNLAGNPPERPSLTSG